MNPVRTTFSLAASIQVASEDPSLLSHASVSVAGVHLPFVHTRREVEGTDPRSIWLIPDTVKLGKKTVGLGNPFGFGWRFAIPLLHSSWR